MLEFITSLSLMDVGIGLGGICVLLGYILAAIWHYDRFLEKYSCLYWSDYVMIVLFPMVIFGYIVYRVSNVFKKDKAQSYVDF